ncbi:hypothetical protein J6590_031821 [Homalodisca vitripennis]|nr:hypothetical protein J6590_031821 [Homalodisca vitripennis]
MVKPCIEIRLFIACTPCFDLTGSLQIRTCEAKEFSLLSYFSSNQPSPCRLKSPLLLREQGAHSDLIVNYTASLVKQSSPNFADDGNFKLSSTGELGVEK